MSLALPDVHTAGQIAAGGGGEQTFIQGGGEVFTQGEGTEFEQGE